MAFDLSTAQPVTQGGLAAAPGSSFNLATATPVAPAAQPSTLNSALGILSRVGNGVISGIPETMLHLGTGAVAGLGGGLNYLGTLAATGGDTDAAKAVQEATQQALTYQPRTKEGKAIANAADKALGLIPAALNKAGEVTADATGSPLLGAAVNTGGNALLQLAGLRSLRGAGAAEAGAADSLAANAAPRGATAPKSVPTTPAEQLAQSLNNGKDVGYQVTPNFDPGASFLDRLGQGIAGKAQVEQGARLNNQGVTNALASRSIGLPPQALITQQALQQVRQAAIDKGYAPIAELDGPITADAQYMRNMADIRSANGDELSGNPDVAATANILMGLKGKAAAGSSLAAAPSGFDPLTLQQRTSLPSFDPATVTDQISTLRSRAQDAYAAGRPSAGQAFRQQAGELEALVDRHLQDLDDVSPDMLNNYRAARQLIAKTHTIQDALNPSTGNVDATAIGSKLQNGVPLDGDLKTIADFANSAPSISGIPIGAPLPTSPLNTMAGAAAAHATGGMSLALIPAARSFAASWLLRHADKPGMLQPVGKSLGQSALDAVHGNAKAFASLYGGLAPGALISTEPDANAALRGLSANQGGL